MEWMGQMLERDDVDWQQALAAHDNWDYQSQGLTEAGAIILTIVVTYFTAGAASGVAESAAISAGGGATGAAVGAAAGAGLTSLATTAAVSFANNGGDIGQTLEDMGKSENVRNILAAMLTAGVGTAMPSTSMSGVLAQTATGCATGEMVGIGCESGATNAAVTSGAALTYSTMVGYTADLRPGENRNGAGQNNATYVPDRDQNSPTFGQQLPADRGMNIIGYNEPGLIGSQGETISVVLNQVSFINATAGLHDYIFNADLLTQSTFNNIWTMGASALLTIPATLNDPSLSWLFVNGAPYSISTLPNPPVVPVIVGVPNTTQ